MFTSLVTDGQTDRHVEHIMPPVWHDGGIIMITAIVCETFRVDGQ